MVFRKQCPKILLHFSKHGEYVEEHIMQYAEKWSCQKFTFKVR